MEERGQKKDDGGHIWDEREGWGWGVKEPWTNQDQEGDKKKEGAILLVYVKLESSTQAESVQIQLM